MEETKFNEIAGKIMRHSNYGKRNPMDIGLEYGYKKEELEKFICCLKEKKNDIEPEYVYMVLEDKLCEVNLNNFTVQEVKSVSSIDRYKIRKDIFVEYTEWSVNWYRAHSADKGCKTFNHITEVHIVRSGILVSNGNEICLLYWNGDVSPKFSLPMDINQFSIAIEDKNGIYLGRTRSYITSIQRINSKFDKIDIILDAKEEKHVSAVGIEQGELYYYTIDKYRVNAATGEKCKVNYKTKNAVGTSITENLVLDDYIICRDSVMERNRMTAEEKYGLFDFIGKITSSIYYLGVWNEEEFNLKQAVAVPSKNWIVGVRKIGGKERIARVDLNENTYAVAYGSEKD